VNRGIALVQAAVSDQQPLFDQKLARGPRWPACPGNWEPARDRFQEMQVFLAVAEEQGFAAGARRLNMSPPSVTRAVAAPEERIGTLLLNRTTRSVYITGAGERFAADCQRILAQVQEAGYQVQRPCMAEIKASVRRLVQAENSGVPGEKPSSMHFCRTIEIICCAI